MPSRWRYLPFGKVCDHSAFGPRFSSDEYAIDGNVACLRTTDIGSDGRIDFGSMPLAKLELDKFRNHILQRDDLVITRTGAYLGKVAVFSDFRLPVLTGAFSIRFRLNRQVADPQFIRYYFGSPEGQSAIQSIATGSVQPNLNITNLHKLTVPLPSIAEQRQIVEILAGFDDKIELNRRMNETLEGMARALFKSWFVDFDPVRAKLDHRPPPGLDPATAALFPNHFEHTASGIAPAAWGFGCVRDLCERVENGGTPKREVASYWTPPEVPWLTSGEVRDRFIVGTENFVSREGLASSSAKMWPAFTTVVALYGATAGYATCLGMEPCANQACCALIPAADSASFVFLLASLSLDAFQQQTRGSAQQNLSQTIVAELPTIVPPHTVLKAFNQLAQPLLTKCLDHLRQSRTLAALRDALLPKLLSGKIRIQSKNRHQ